MIKTFKNFKSPNDPGSYHRLICMTGKNKGLSYFFDENRIILGRGDQANIQVLDTKSSRRHAELVLLGNHYVISDLGSQNGIIINDLKVQQHKLVENDKIIIGATIFKYNYIEIYNDNKVNGDIIKQDSHRLENKEKKTKSKKNVYTLVLILISIFFILDRDKPKISKKKSGKINSQRELINTKNINKKKYDKNLINKMKSIIHRGRRELREQNYFRAIEQFNLVLIMDPGNGEASFLLKKSQQRLDEFIKKISRKGSNETDQKRYSGAIMQWCEIVRYLRKHPKDKRYLDAQKQVKFLSEKLGYESNEYKCF